MKGFKTWYLLVAGLALVIISSIMQDRREKYLTEQGVSKDDIEKQTKKYAFTSLIGGIAFLVGWVLMLKEK